MYYYGKPVNFTDSELHFLRECFPQTNFELDKNLNQD